CMSRCRAIRDDGGEIFARRFALPVRSEQAREFAAIYFVVGRERAQFLPTTDRKIELGKLGGRVGGERERLIVVDAIRGFRQFDARVLDHKGPEPSGGSERGFRRRACLFLREVEHHLQQRTPLRDVVRFVGEAGQRVEVCRVVLRQRELARVGGGE